MDALDPNRLRLIEGLSSAIAAKGYAATTIADIVRHARVSKRTFYDHFRDKEDCFLESYRLASEQMLVTLGAAIDRDKGWDEQVRDAAQTYFKLLEENPALTRTFMLEIHAAGGAAMKLRREIHQRFADFLRSMVASTRKKHPQVRALSPAMATALVGGINELAIVALEKARAGGLRELAETATELVRAVLVGARA